MTSFTSSGEKFGFFKFEMSAMSSKLPSNTMSFQLKHAFVVFYSWQCTTSAQLSSNWRHLCFNSQLTQTWSLAAYIKHAWKKQLRGWKLSTSLMPTWSILYHKLQKELKWVARPVQQKNEPPVVNTKLDRLLRPDYKPWLGKPQQVRWLFSPQD